MESTRITELLQPFLGAGDGTPAGPEIRLAPAQLDHISIYIDILTRWNARMNLTAVRAPEQILARHFGESLFTARCLFPHGAAGHLIDVGSGAGFPGLPLKIWAGNLRVTLIESNQKKATFLREVVRATTLTDIDVFPGRAEDYEGDLGNTVTMRAVEKFELAATVALDLAAPGGRLALLVAERQADTAHRLLSGVQWEEPVSIPLSEHRILLIGHKQARK